MCVNVRDVFDARLIAWVPLIVIQDRRRSVRLLSCLHEVCVTVALQPFFNAPCPQICAAPFDWHDTARRPEAGVCVRVCECMHFLKAPLVS